VIVIPDSERWLVKRSEKRRCSFRGWCLRPERSVPKSRAAFLFGRNRL